MSCDNKPYDCNNPIDLNASNLSINQVLNNLDTASCGLNSIFASISEQLSNLLGSSINIDIDSFIKCNRKIWDKKIRVNKQTVSEYVSFNDITIAKLKKCLADAGYALNQINAIIDRANKIKQIQSWIFNNKVTGRVENNLDNAKSRIFYININCDSEPQSYSNDTFTESLDNCSKECAIPIKLLIQAESSDILNKTSFSSLPELLCSTGPVICNFTFTNSEFNTFYNNSKGSNDPEDSIFEWTPGTSLSTPNTDCPVSHTVVLVGYECFPNNINPTHYLFKFKDSYLYGENGQSRDGYFTIKVPANNVEGNFSSQVPWNIGDTYGMNGNFRIYGVVIKPLKSVEEIQQLKENCCETPTPTPTNTPSETETPFPTPTETPS